MKTFLVLAAYVVAATPLFAQEVDGTKFRSIEEGVWYHPISLETWIYNGGDENTLVRTLNKIES